MKDVLSATAPRWRPRCKASRMRSPLEAHGVSEDGVRQLAAGLWCIGQRKGGRVHAFLCEDGGELTLVDTLYDLDGARILEQIRRIGRQPSALRRIVLTHGHRSHLGGLAASRRRAVRPCTRTSGKRTSSAASGRPSRSASSPIGRSDVLPLPVRLSLGIGAHPPCPVDEVVAGGDRVGPLEVLDAPGHSPGHLAFLWAERRALIAGDSIATWPGFMAGWAAFNLNVPKHRATIRRSRRRSRRPSASATARRSRTARRHGSATSRTPSHGSARVCSVRARDRPGQEPRGGQVPARPGARAGRARRAWSSGCSTPSWAACRNASAITDARRHPRARPRPPGRVLVDEGTDTGRRWRLPP